LYWISGAAVLALALIVVTIVMVKHRTATVQEDVNIQQVQTDNPFEDPTVDKTDNPFAEDIGDNPFAD
jgi:hypothetical protein